MLKFNNSKIKIICKKCEQEKIIENCSGGCHVCGKFLSHGENHTQDCTAEEDYNQVMREFDDP